MQRNTPAKEITGNILAVNKPQEQLLESVLNLTVEGIAAIDQNGTIFLCNHAYARLFGKNVEDLIGKPIQEVDSQSGLLGILTGHGLEKVVRKQIKGSRTIHFHKYLGPPEKIQGAVEFIIHYGSVGIDEELSLLKRLENEINYYRDTITRWKEYDFSLEQIVGRNSKILDLKRIIRMVAKTNSSVLIQGESGTGKELFARAIHGSSSRGCQPMIQINCAAIPEPLMEAELFGYEEGAFTGAKKGGKIGRFELAHQGSLFLDEIGDIPLAMQAKLLRVLQEREFERVGGTKPISVDVRLIAATNKDLWSEVNKGNFREDLYYRINVVNIQVPPLRERKDDISILSKFLLAKLSRKLGCGPKELADEVIRLFERYSWPGNVREMENVLESALNMLGDEPEVMVQHLPFYLRHMTANADSPGVRTLSMVVEEAERAAMVLALRQAGGDFNEAARLLSISRSSFYMKAKKYQLKTR